MLYHNKTIGTLAYMGGLPCNLEKFTWSWGQLIAFSAEYVCNPGERIHLLKSAVSHHQTARNQLAREFLGDWLLMLDMDHAFEPDLLARLLHRMHRYQLDVLSGLYCFRSETPSPVLYGWLEEGGQEGFAPLGDWDDEHIQSIAGAGGGCLLVHRRVFDRIRDELGENPFDPPGAGGEDLAFFLRLRRLGIKAYFDPRVECPHLSVSPLTKDHVQRRRDIQAIDAEGFKVI